MAMNLGRNLGKYFTTVGPFSAGFGGSSTARSGGSAGAMVALLPARRQFSSWSTRNLKRELRELMAEFKELSFSECLHLTIASSVTAYLLHSTVRGIAKLTKSVWSRTGIANLKFSSKRDGGGTDGGSSRDDGV